MGLDDGGFAAFSEATLGDIMLQLFVRHVHKHLLIFLLLIRHHFFSLFGTGSVALPLDRNGPLERKMLFQFHERVCAFFERRGILL